MNATIPPRTYLIRLFAGESFVFTYSTLIIIHIEIRVGFARLIARIVKESSPLMSNCFTDQATGNILLPNACKYRELLVGRQVILESDYDS